MKDIDGYVTKDELYRLISHIKMNPNIVVDDKMCHAIVNAISDMPAADVQPIYYAENVQNEVLNYLFNKEREAESMSYGDKRQERIATIREIIRFVEDIDPRMDGDKNG